MLDPRRLPYIGGTHSGEALSLLKFTGKATGKSVCICWRPKTQLMKRTALFLSGIVSIFLSGNVGAEQPRGTVLELHSCELYAGGCVVSSESTLGGRYMVRAWDFTGGEYAGTELKGLKVGLL